MKKFFIITIVLTTLSIHSVFASEVKDPNIFDNVDDAVAYALDQFDYDVHANYRVTWEDGEYILYWILQDGATYEGQLRESTSEESTMLEESTTLEESTRPIFESITTKEETTEEESTSPPTTEYTTQETPPLSEFKPDPIITWLKRLIYLIAAIIILVLILLLIGLFKPNNKPRH